jgi:putative endonuclease
MYKKGYVYILASRKHGTLYIGVTSNLSRRMEEHRSGVVRSFTSRYRIKRLVWIEEFDDIREAIEREKQLKKWHRQWKIALIERVNPHWKDLSDKLL